MNHSLSSRLSSQAHLNGNENIAIRCSSNLALTSIIRGPGDLKRCKVERPFTSNVTFVKKLSLNNKKGIEKRKQNCYLKAARELLIFNIQFELKGKSLEEEDAAFTGNIV